MYRLFYFSLFCITSAVGFAACAHTDKQAADLQDIKILEGKTYQATRLEPQLAIKIIEKYSNYATNYPTDTANAPKFWVKAGEVANAIGKGSEAIELWHHVLADYATKPLAAQALFMTAFAYENTLHEEANARRYYARLLRAGA